MVLSAFPIAAADWAEHLRAFGRGDIATFVILLPAALLGLALGPLLAWWIAALGEGPVRDALVCAGCGRPRRRRTFAPLLPRRRCSACRRPPPRWVDWLPWGTAALFALVALASLQWRVLDTPEVQPSDVSRIARLLFHLALLSLLIVATGVDFDAYLIPDAITITGALLAVAGAFVVGELQIIHLWVDWNLEVPGVRGPFIPAWFDQHRHLHGLAWSLAGLATGAGLTWLVRFVASRILGQEALGFGDVTLMGMIGAFVGWQPVVFVFLLAPLCGLLVALAQRLAGGKTYLPYGPYLSAAALVVLLGWNRLWVPVRTIFGDPPSLLILAGVSVAAFVILLALLRLYRAIPGKQRD